MTFYDVTIGCYRAKQESKKIVTKYQATGRAYVSGFRTGTAGGYKLILDMPEMDIDEAKKVLELVYKNVEFALVGLPE